MSRIRNSNTKPEMIVRSLLHHLGLRFRLHQRELPGRPDIVLKRHRTIVMVHGCFWHRHKGCRNCTTPTGNRDYWMRKFAVNVERDKRVSKELHKLGWRIIVVWECETRRTNDRLEQRLRRLFELS